MLETTSIPTSPTTGGEGAHPSPARWPMSHPDEIAQLMGNTDRIITTVLGNLEARSAVEREIRWSWKRRQKTVVERRRFLSYRDSHTPYSPGWEVYNTAAHGDFMRIIEMNLAIRSLFRIRRHLGGRR